LSPLDPRREAYRILSRVDEAGAFASVLLERSGRELGDPRDVALLTELVLGVLRRRAALDHAIARAASRPPEEIDRGVMTALRLGAYALLVLDRIPDFAAVDTSVRLVREAGAAKAAGFANGVLRRIARERRDLLPPAPVAGDVEALALYHSHPTWWTRRVVGRMGWERAESLLRADNEPAATVLAPWPRSCSAAELAAALEGEGVVTEPCRFVPAALRVTSGVPQSTRAFRDGWFWIQDEASQLVVTLFGETAGPAVADLCAAPGGKTLALAARLLPGGRIVAVDRRLARLARLRANLARVGAGGVDLLAADLTRTPPLAGAFDDVLLDAPCSGTGTLRRHPEIRWRLAPDDIPALAARQQRLLESAATLVAPGGRLVYAVCSLEPEEGAGVVSAFLESHPEFDPKGAALSTSPLDDGLDGFFAVRLLRRANWH